MTTLHLSLDGIEINSTDGTGWYIDDNRINIVDPRCHATYTLPRNQRRVTLYRNGDRSQLVVGTLSTITMSITGPAATIDKLREAVL